MASGQTTTEITCPACSTPLTIPVALALADRRGGDFKVTFDTSAVHRHVAEHGLTDLPFGATVQPPTG